ncbi:MAG: hypothetical protein ACC682_07300 [Gemmatimonadota bacterium]
MKTTFQRAALPILIAIVIGACASEADMQVEADAALATAGVPPIMGGAAPMTPEQQQRQMELFTELQAIDQQLQAVRDRAMSDPGIKALEADLVAEIEAAMEEVQPGSIAMREEFDGLVDEYTAAQEAGDQEKVAEMGPQLQTMDMALRQAQSTVMQRPEMVAKVEEFQESMFAHMRKIDVSADSLITRGEKLNGELQTLMSGAEN